MISRNRGARILTGPEREAHSYLSAEMHYRLPMLPPEPKWSRIDAGWVAVEDRWGSRWIAAGHRGWWPS